MSVSTVISLAMQGPSELHARHMRLIVILLLSLMVAALAGVMALAYLRGVSPDIAALLARVPKYNPAGRYVSPLNDRSNIDPPSVIVSSRGLPLVRYDAIGYQENPVATSQYGLWAYGVYVRTGDDAHRRIVLRVAGWLLRNQTGDGRWLYEFNFAFHHVSVSKPWSSAMAQGQAMSLLERAYRMTGDTRYRRAAVRALAPLQTDVRDGGLRRCFFGNCRLPFYEEYATNPPSYVLNGFMFTLFGLYDLASIAPRSKALSMYEAGRQTLATALPQYDIRGVSSYDLTHLTAGEPTPPIADQMYAGVHVYLLRALDALEPNGLFRFYANRWAANVKHLPS
jgi:heparosan-N-sulfate-glucuronate 5-epimerase